MKTARSSICLPLLVVVALAQADVPAAEPSAAELGRTVAALDTRLFDAYNRRDLDALAAIVADDLEFHHDKTGLSRGRAPLIEAIRNNICGKVHRDLVPGSLEVTPCTPAPDGQVPPRQERSRQVRHALAQRRRHPEAHPRHQLRPRIRPGARQAVAPSPPARPITGPPQRVWSRPRLRRDRVAPVLL